MSYNLSYMSYSPTITTTPTSGALAQSQAARARCGFTLVEMIMTMAIAAILLTIAIPSFRYVTNSNRIAGELNGLLGDLQFARAEAIKEGRTVTVCVSNDGATCANSTTWQSGWIVFSRSRPTWACVDAGRDDLPPANDTFEHATPSMPRTTFLRSPSTATVMPSASPTAP